MRYLPTVFYLFFPFGPGLKYFLNLLFIVKLVILTISLENHFCHNTIQLLRLNTTCSFIVYDGQLDNFNLSFQMKITAIGTIATSQAPNCEDP